MVYLFGGPEETWSRVLERAECSTSKPAYFARHGRVGTAYGNGSGGPRTRRNTRGRDWPAIGGTLTRENVDRFLGCP